MKKLAIASALVFVTPAAFGVQLTCASHGAPTTTTPTSITAQTTCQTGAVNEFGTICGGSSSTGPNNVYEITVGGNVTPNNFTLTVTQTDATYDAAAFLVGPTTCDGATGCPDQDDNTGPGIGNQEILTAAAITPGAYFLVVTSTNGFSTTAGGAACGAYTVDITGTLPVSLQSFSVD